LCSSETLGQAEHSNQELSVVDPGWHERAEECDDPGITEKEICEDSIIVEPGRE
jgi:hypothetical protein